MIRNATRNDIPKLVEWSISLLDHVGSRGIDIYMRELSSGVSRRMKNEFTRSIESDDAAVLIFENANGDSVGFIMGRLTRPYIRETRIGKIGYIDMCWVDHGHRNKGIAGSLIKRLEAWLTQRDIRYIDLHCAVSNIEAQEVWEKHQYRPYRISMMKDMGRQ